MLIREEESCGGRRMSRNAVFPRRLAIVGDARAFRLLLTAVIAGEVYGGCGARSGLDTTPVGSIDASDGASLGDSGFEDAGPADVKLESPAPDAACDASSSAEPTWLNDACLWHALPGLETCDVLEAQLPSSTFPKRSFESCGPGCRVGNGALDTSWQYFSMWRGWFDQGASYVRLGSWVDKKHVNEVLDVTHNQALAATQVRNTIAPPNWVQCSTSATRPLGPVLIESWHHWTGDPTVFDNPGTIWFARVDYRNASTFQVLPGTFDMPPNHYSDLGLLVASDSATGYLAGRLFAAAGSSQVPPLPAVSPFPLMYTHDLTAWGSTFVWRDSDGTKPGRVHAWSPEDGYRVLHQSSQRVVASAVGNSGAVWLEGTPTVGQFYEDLTLLWVKDLAKPEPMVVAKHLMEPTASGITLGDGLVGYVGCDVKLLDSASPSSCALYVVELLSGTVHSFGPPTKATYWANVVVVNARELVVGELDKAPFFDNQGTSTRLFVLDTSDLAGLDVAFPWAKDGG